MHIPLEYFDIFLHLQNKMRESYFHKTHTFFSSKLDFGTFMDFIPITVNLLGFIALFENWQFDYFFFFNSTQFNFIPLLIQFQVVIISIFILFIYFFLSIDGLRIFSTCLKQRIVHSSSV